jgi:hypothetical protein
MCHFALFSPGTGWFVRRDAATFRDVFSDDLREACFFGSEPAAVEYSVALTERCAGGVWWVYGVSLLHRRVGGLR